VGSKPKAHLLLGGTVGAHATAKDACHHGEGCRYLYLLAHARRVIDAAPN
jgi:hypothetical protein